MKHLRLKNSMVSWIVGTIHDEMGLKILDQMSDNLTKIDLIEIRLDAFQQDFVPRFSIPHHLIATARHPAEGGKNNLPAAIRYQLLKKSLEWCDIIDIELKSLEDDHFLPLISLAKQYGKQIILSYHDFHKTPTFELLEDKIHQAIDLGGNFIKLAVFLQELTDLTILIKLQNKYQNIQLATMGMGELGRFSRVVLSGFGSSLCYGWLGKSQVKGQWPAYLLHQVLTQSFQIF